MSTLNVNHKSKPEDIIGSYNSLKDPHLRTHFRKPQIRRHLIKANIINKDNKIVEEISTTKHQQNVKRKQKKELYQMLNELVGLNSQEHSNHETLLNNAKIILSNGSKFNDSNFSKKQQNQITSSNQQRTLLLQKLDRMIKAIKEHHEQTSSSRPIIKDKIIKSNLRTKSKSQHDVSLDSFNDTLNQSFQLNRSTPQLSHKQNSIRPKSSYGRSRKGHYNSNDDIKDYFHYESLNGDDSIHKNTATRHNSLKKCVSLANIQNNTNNNYNDDCQHDFDEIKSLDGESLDDSVISNDDNDYNGNQSRLLLPIMHFPLKKSPPYLLTSNDTFTNNSIINNNTDYNKYYEFDKRFIKSSSSHQRVKMTFRYNGLNGATNHGGKRNVKVNQQIHIGGNSILIYDGFVKPGEIFSFEVRPHSNNSFSINILVNGIRDLRLNTCCERKHRPGTTLSHFTIVDIVGGRACFNCRLLLQQSPTITTTTTSTFETNESIAIADDDEYEDYDGTTTTTTLHNHIIELHGSKNPLNKENQTTTTKIIEKKLPTTEDIAVVGKNEKEKNQKLKTTNIFLSNNNDNKNNDNYSNELSPSQTPTTVFMVNGQQKEDNHYKTNGMENHNHENNHNKLENNNDLHFYKNDQQKNMVQIPVINDNGTDVCLVNENDYYGHSVGGDVGSNSKDIFFETMPHVENISSSSEDDDPKEQ